MLRNIQNSLRDFSPKLHELSKYHHSINFPPKNSLKLLPPLITSLLLQIKVQIEQKTIPNSHYHKPQKLSKSNTSNPLRKRNKLCSRLPPDLRRNATCQANLAPAQKWLKWANDACWDAINSSPRRESSSPRIVSDEDVNYLVAGVCIYLHWKVRQWWIAFRNLLTAHDAYDFGPTRAYSAR